MVIFAYGSSVTIAVIDRRPHRRDESRDVLEKITLIKDIDTFNPHRAHIEILVDLSLSQLIVNFPVENFLQLHRAWQSVLNISELNKRFYRELSDWYFWAVKEVTFPSAAGEDPEVRNATSVIRLITRLMFVWFLKEKGLIPVTLFRDTVLDHLLHNLGPEESTYYKAILQNLFFATLNQEMGSRSFWQVSQQQDNITNLYHYADYFVDTDQALQLFASIPFLNGGLFECLDKTNPDLPEQISLIDGFSDRADNPVEVPNFLFFSQQREVDLNQDYGTKNKSYRVGGLFHVFDRYKFTIAENTPLEQEVALDPELLGQVFENLLAAYNPETETTARKQTGSFYTPRQIVNYMLDESLVAYLLAKLKVDSDIETIENKLKHLMSFVDEPHQFEPAEVRQMIQAIDSLRILDPSCGSGAFPMGILQKLVFVLSKLDPNNQRWRKQQLDAAQQIADPTARDYSVQSIQQAFDKNELNYGRKLYLIQRCIYGVDIQPIAVQIAKLRCFIALVVDQKIDDSIDNRGILPLPNLETKFVAANTLINVDRPAQMMIQSEEIDIWEDELAEVRKDHFMACTIEQKARCRDLDAQIRTEIITLLDQEGFPSGTLQKIASWDPYDQNTSANFFDPKWMFGVADGFDIVIGNPPYVRQEKIRELKPILQAQYDCYMSTADLYVYFYECGLCLLKEKGLLIYITSNKYFRTNYGKKLRQFLNEHSTIRQLIDFGDAPVFTAVAYPSIILLRKQKPKENSFRALDWMPQFAVEEFDAVLGPNSFLMPQTALKDNQWSLVRPEELDLLSKLQVVGQPLGEYVDGAIYTGIKTGFNQAFVVDRQTKDTLIAEDVSSTEVLKPFLRGKDIKRWCINDEDYYLIKIESSANMQHPWSGGSAEDAEMIFANIYPAIHAHFEPYRSELLGRQDQGYYFWELRSCAYWREFECPKIIYSDISKEGTFTLDDQGYLLGNTASILPTNEKWLIGLLNSKIVLWLYTKISTQIRGGFVRFIAQYVSQIPIPLVPQDNSIYRLVDQIILAKQTNPSANITDLEQQIDQLVYQLYDLTDEEIAIVEESTSRR